jgi:hypothetical protein
MASLKAHGRNGINARRRGSEPSIEEISMPGSSTSTVRAARKTPRRNTASARKGEGDNRLSDAFLKDLSEDWEAHGAAAIASVRTERPHEYLKLITSFFAREDNAKANLFDELSDEQLGAQLCAILKQLEASGADPGPGAGAAPQS